jgi:DNA-binding NarL/FixJ family response regulator
MAFAAAVRPNPPAAHAIRVFVAEDHQITLWGLRRLIDSVRPHMEVVGTASSCAELLNHDAAADADVILLDLDLAGENSTDALADLRQRCPGRVLVLTGADDVDRHRSAVMKGARGVVHKSEPADVILRAIEKVNGGEVWLNRTLLGDVLGLLTDHRNATAAQADPHIERMNSLTQRERQIVTAMVRHAGAKQLVVADELHMSEHTLRNHLTTIYSKLGVHGRLELHVYATEHGLGGASRTVQ